MFNRSHRPTSPAASASSRVRHAPGQATVPGRTGLAVAAALVGVLGGVLVQAPARWLADVVGSASNGQVQLLNARGTVWQGQAHVLLSGGSGSQDRTLLPTPLRWHLRPTWLGQAADTAPSNTSTSTSSDAAASGTGPSALRGLALAVGLGTECCLPNGLQLWVQPNWRGLALHLAPHQSQWPAELLAGLGTPWNTLQLQAQLALSTSAIGLQLGPTGLRSQGTATLDVRDAASRLSTLRPMGSYRLTWQASHQVAPTLNLSTVQGALLLQGRGEWIAGRLRFQGDAQASPGREDALANLLNILGRRQGARSLITIG